MYLHVGSGTVVRESQVVGIFDLDGPVTTPDTADFLRRAERDGTAEMAGAALPKCFIVCSAPRRRGKKPCGKRVIFAHLAAGVIGGRADA